MLARTLLNNLKSVNSSSRISAMIWIGRNILFGVCRHHQNQTMQTAGLKIQPLLLKRTFSITTVSTMPRSEHFKYFGDEGNTPRRASVMAKKSKKADKVKQKARKKDGTMKATLEERMEEERLKEDIEETVNMVRKRLHLDDTAIPKLHMNIDYLLAQNLPIHVIRKMCTQAPKTISMEMNLLKKKITAFKINSFFEESMVKIFNKNPKILLLKVEDTLTVKVETIRRLPISLELEQIVDMIERCPDIIQYLSTDKIVEKVTFLQDKAGFNIQQIRRILLKNPAVFTMNMQNVKDKIDFCVKNFNVNLEKISKYPRVFQSPLDKVKERYAFLEEQKLTGVDIQIKGWAFKAVVANSDVYFAEKIAQKPLKKFRNFQDKWRGKEAEVRATAPSEVAANES